MLLIVLPLLAGFHPYEKTQSDFRYCFSGLSSSQRARFRDAIVTWQARESRLSGEEVPCTDARGATTVRMAGIDGRANGVNPNRLAQVEWGFGFPTLMTFDSAEVWYSGTGQPPCGLPSNGAQADFWGVAAHEIGHVFGLDHSYGSPESEHPTMGFVSYECGSEAAFRARYLSSDDEAGAHFIQNGSWIPNPGFERSQDCVSQISCEPAFYWQTNGGNVSIDYVCNGANAQAGNCYGAVHPSVGPGFVHQSVYRFHIYPGQMGLFAVWLRNRSGSIMPVRLSVLESEDELGGVRCNLPAGSPWTLCITPFQVSRFSLTSFGYFQFQIEKKTAGGTLWVDSASVVGLPLDIL